MQPAGFTSALRHRSALRVLGPLVSPLPRCQGGFVSVALSLGSPPVAVSDCHSLCCPDFPRTFLRARDQPIIWPLMIISPLFVYTKVFVEGPVDGGIGQLVKLAWHVAELNFSEAFNLLLNGVMNWP